MKIDTDQVIKAKTVKVRGCFGCWFNAPYFSNVPPYNNLNQARYICKATQALAQNSLTFIEPIFLTQDSKIPSWCPLLKNPVIVQIEDSPSEKKNMDLWDYLTEELERETKNEELGKLCEKCGSEMDARGPTPPYMTCNTWVCPKCNHVEPEIASGKLK